MTKTLVDLDDALLAEAMEALGATTKADAIRKALSLVTRQARQRRAIEWLTETGALDALNDPEVRAAARR